MEQKKVLVVIPMVQEQRSRLKEALPGAEYYFTSIGEVTEEQVQQAEIILGNVPPEMIQKSQRLLWLHLNSAGYDPYVKEGILGSHTILTTSSGAYGKAVSEHMFAMLLALMKKLHRYRDDQKQHIWGEEGEVVSIGDAVILILGAGDIGKHFAKQAHALGAYVIGVKRSLEECPPCMDELHVNKELKELLPRADAVVSFLPSTNESRGLFNKDLFALMKKGSYFVNGGRGDLVCTEDLCDALESGHLAGAALDVTDPEPLPKDHRLWDVPNAFITPHVSGFYHLPETLRNVVAICTENVRRYHAGEPLRNVVKR
ncbi:MAG: D-2-hydroxyacid dehydrogenase [Lachnospiraceae bacterium]|nr:D-2-hydroxyacid dehydrogenase [Lachnospiraceae bacterium]MCI9659794.1 D-2-hydroxyacid dehydrogenase [Lachnospiraceae bacterium]